MPKVSIILPNYNHSGFLDQRLESIFAQTYQDFELIILDDASSDGSQNVIEKYNKYPQIKEIIYNSQNSGSPFIQWEKGLKLAQGEYIWIAESDDVADKNFIKKLVYELETDPKTGIVFCPSIWINENGDEIHIPDFEQNENDWYGKDLVQNEFLVGNLIYNASSAIFRKNLLQYVDFDTIRKFKYTGDWYFWILMVPHTQVVRIEDRLNYFRRHPNNVSFKSESEGLQFIEGIKIVEHILENHPVEFLKKRKAMLFWARKMLHSDGFDKKNALEKMPTEMKLYYKLLNLLP